MMSNETFTFILDDNKTSAINFTKYFSDYTCKNVLTYVSEPSRTRDFSLQNDDIDAKYVPQFTGTLSYMEPEDYIEFITRVNTKGFYFKYYDYTIGKYVNRKMYCTDESINQISNYGLKLKALIGVKITFVGKYGYQDYDELKRLADDKLGGK